MGAAMVMTYLSGKCQKRREILAITCQAQFIALVGGPFREADGNGKSERCAMERREAEGIFILRTIATIRPRVP